MNRDLPTGVPVAARILDVIERDILPITAAAVEAGNKIFGAALLRKSDLSVILAATNNETENPLWHAEVHALKQFYELPDSARPETKDCLFVATHEPCSLCLSAITWTGFDNFYYLFGHEATRDVFDIPHDLAILKEVFSLAPGEYNTANAYWTSHRLTDLIETDPGEPDGRLKARIDGIRDQYRTLTRRYRAISSSNKIPFD